MLRKTLLLGLGRVCLEEDKDVVDDHETTFGTVEIAGMMMTMFAISSI